MEVQIAFECIGDQVSKYWSQRHTHQPLAEDIKQNAIKAWQNREPGQIQVRFMQRMSDTHYRFLNVKQNGNKLIVSR
ncbi:hemophilus-specific protein [Pasteurellaceae bacterium LIM206]|nr:hemophilus-specific protein [Pasteurellaceae bacterium LIM206]